MGELYCRLYLLVQTVLVFCVRNCVFLLICVAGRVAGSPSSLRDHQGHQKLAIFFSLKKATSSLQNRRFDSEVTVFYIPYILSLSKPTVLHINPFQCGSLLILNSPPDSVQLV